MPLNPEKKLPCWEAGEGVPPEEATGPQSKHRGCCPKSLLPGYLIDNEYQNKQAGKCWRMLQMAKSIKPRHKGNEEIGALVFCIKMIYSSPLKLGDGVRAMPCINLTIHP